MTTWMSARNESALEVQPQRGVVGLRAGDQANSLHVAYAREVHDLDVSVVDCECGEIQLRGGSDGAKAAKVTIGRNLTGAPTTTILLGALAAAVMLRTCQYAFACFPSTVNCRRRRCCGDPRPSPGICRDAAASATSRI